MHRFHLVRLRNLTTLGVILLILIAGCTSREATRTFSLDKRLTAPAGSSMLAWTTSDGVTKEFIFVGREDAIVKLLYREYRKGEPQDLLDRELVFAVAENYTARSEMNAITLVVFEGYELRIFSLEGQSVVYEIMQDCGEAESPGD
jgi:hypothetical protein